MTLYDEWIEKNKNSVVYSNLLVEGWDINPDDYGLDEIEMERSNSRGTDKFCLVVVKREVKNGKPVNKVSIFGTADLKALRDFLSLFD